MVEVMYNKRTYKVYNGVRGGTFIKVKGNKKYINLNKMMKKKGGTYPMYQSRCEDKKPGRKICADRNNLQSKKKEACDKFYNADGRWSADDFSPSDLRACESAITKEQMCRHMNTNNGHCAEWEKVGKALRTRNHDLWKKWHGWK